MRLHKKVPRHFPVVTLVEIFVRPEMHSKSLYGTCACTDDCAMVVLVPKDRRQPIVMNACFLNHNESVESHFCGCISAPHVSALVRGWSRASFAIPKTFTSPFLHACGFVDSPSIWSDPYNRFRRVECMFANEPRRPLW